MDDLGSLILDLVRIPSVTGSERALADLLEQRLAGGPAGRDHDLRRLGDTLVLLPRAPIAGRPLLLLAGHIDTVPRDGAPEPAWDGGCIVGRGACDMKAGVAVLLALAEGLRAEDGFARRAFVFYAGEEGPAVANGLGAALEAVPELRGASLGLLLEPTSGDLELGCNGSLHVTVTFRGRACHSARPWQGRHPLRAALDWLERTLDRPVREVEIAGARFRELISLTRLRAGEVRNVIPGELELNLNLRFAPDRDRHQAERLAIDALPAGAALRGFASAPDAADAAWETADVAAGLVDFSPAGAIDLEAPLYRFVLESTGLPRRGKQGWTDVARLTSCGIPALNWGPGDPDLAHTKEERVDVAEAETCLARLRALLAGPGPGAA